MVIGDGDIASVLPERSGLLFFASGVSDSACTDDREFVREIQLLMKQPKDKHLVYFSSFCVYYGNSSYAEHKRMMERLVKQQFEHYTIMRLGNITWGKNPKTLLNFLHHKIKSGQDDYAVEDVYRYLVRLDEFLYWIDMIPKWSGEMNVPGRRLKVAEIVKEIKAGKL